MVSTVRPSPPSCCSTAEARNHPEVSADINSHIRRRCSKLTKGLPKGWRKKGINQTSSIGSVALTKSAANKCPMCGGLKEPPNSATSKSTPPHRQPLTSIRATGDDLLHLTPDRDGTGSSPPRTAGGRFQSLP